MFFKNRLKKASPEEEADFSKRMQENEVGAKDAFAMVLTAFLTIVLPCLGVLLALGGLVMLLFGALS